jgi:pimeloyl-ACP methyl ester carboxylesterase
MATVVLLGLLFLPFLLIGGGVAIFWRSRRRKVLRWTWISYLLTAAVILFGVGPYLSAWWLVFQTGTRPRDRALTDTPASYGVMYEEIVFETRDSVRLSGWFIPPISRNAVILCTHGLFRNRVEMLPIAMTACKAGYGALLYDSRSHGSSEKAKVSLGYFERNDVLAGIQYIQRRYQDASEQPQIALMGISMGAVTTLEAAAESKSYSALILDSPFSSLRETVADHTWLFFKMPRYTFASLFLFWFEQLTGFNPDLVDSHTALQRALPVPTLLIGSEGDKRIPSGIVRWLYDESRAPLKKLKLFGKEIPHGAAVRMHSEEYSAILLNFLNAALGQAAVTAEKL